jgi:CheY-like chemotaxis protein
MKKVLVIEDNDAIRDEIAVILGFEDFEVIVAENGREGLRRIEESRPDVILCDLMMPEMDGYETLEALRGDPRSATIPFICLTARAERVDMRRAMDLGADDYVTKPFTADELLAAVNAGLVKRGRATRETEGRVAEVRERQSARIRRLYELAVDPEASPMGQIGAALRLGCEWLGMDIGTVTRVEGETVHVGHVYTVKEMPRPERSGPLADAYTSIAWAAGDVTSFSNASESPYRDHPAYRRLALESYAGVPIAVNGEPYGTLEFAALLPKAGPLGPDDHDALRLLAHWVEAVVTRARAAAQLVEAHARALEATRLKSEFLANMSHEIRTPMTGILGMTELLLETDLTSQQRGFLTVVSSSAQNLLALLNDLLDFSKIEAGRLQIERVPYRLRAELDDAVHSLAVRAHQKNLELVCHIASDVPEAVVGDPLRLRQVVVNLVGNAIKFTDHGEVEVRMVAKSRSKDELTLHISVRDTGIGVPVEHQAAIFGAFTQADGSISRRYEGTGLGLSISAQLVGMMGGRIWVESQVGEGSTFHLTTQLGVAADAPAAAEAVPRALAGRRVLVVDDNPASCRALEDLLREWGMVPAAVTTGAAGVAALEDAARRGAPFAVAIVDSRMPGQDGLATAARIRCAPEIACTPLVLLTTSDHAADAGRDREIEAACVLKPIVAPGRLIEALTTALDGAGVDTPAATGLPRLSAADGGGPRLRVLLADDNAANCTVVSYLLEKRGHQVVTVGDGRQALVAFSQRDFDLVLMDVQMPEMDGLEATRRLRATERISGRHVPVVALTAHAMKGDRERCLDAGMDAYVAKPIQSAELLAVIDGLFPPERPAKNQPGAAPPPAPGATPGDSPGAQSETRSGATGGAPASSSWLEELSAEPARLLDVVATVQRENVQLLEELRGGIARQDARAVERAAHRLKGLLDILGTLAGDDLVAAVGRLEELGRSGSLGDTCGPLGILEEELGRLEPALSALASRAAGAKRA